MVVRRWGGSGVLAAQLRRPEATAAAGHPPLTAAAAAATTVVVYVSRHPCTYVRRRLCASASRTPAPCRAVASRSTPRPARSITHAAVARRGFPIVARVLFNVLCSYVSCSPHQTRALRCDPLYIVHTHVSVGRASVFSFPVAPSFPRRVSTDSESTCYTSDTATLSAAAVVAAICRQTTLQPPSSSQLYTGRI